MEHLLSPATSLPINIPYVGGEDFETGSSLHDDVLFSFKSYWERKGWKRHPATGDLIFEGRSLEEITKSLQTSLYFGCLISVFQRVGITVRTRDFLHTASPRGETFVRTTALPGLTAEWTRREGFTGGAVVRDFNNPKYMRGENIKEILNWTSWYLQMYCQKSEAMAEPHKSLMELVELSIMAMAESLCSVLVMVYGYESREMPTWGPSPVLKNRLRENRWCVSDSPFFPESMTRAAISSDYYFGSAACPRRRQDHATCTGAICNEYLKVITPGAYEQKHTSHLCLCAPVPVPGVAIRLVAEGNIPVIQWDGNTVQISVGGPQTRYVAISHVWSDGLGNDDKANSLLACQLSRIQLLVNNLYSESHGSSNSGCVAEISHEDEMVPFWIDTLCVPVGQENKELRTHAIRQMAEIYRRADKVLVLDSFILTLPRSADVVEKYLRIHLSNWHHRLWTMQEGQLARSLFFQFEDGAESFYDMSHGELQKFDPQAPQNLCSPVRLLCAVELEAFYRYFEGGAHAHGDTTARMRSCAKYLRSRQTSRLEDESVCVATILGLDPGQILERKDPIERMASFYDLVGRFDSRIIFNEHPRLPREGYRWAPRSFLHQLPDLIAAREGGMEDPSHVLLTPGGGGLVVQFGGFEFSSAMALLPGSSVFVKPFTGGLTWAQQQWSWDSGVPWWTCTFKVEFLDMLPDAPTHPDPRYAVTLPGYLHRDFLPVIGVLGIVDANIPPNPSMSREVQWTIWTTNGNPVAQLPAYSVPYRISMRCVCRVRVSMPPQETIPQNVSPAWAWAYRREQEWCIR